MTEINVFNVYMFVYVYVHRVVQIQRPTFGGQDNCRSFLLCRSCESSSGHQARAHKPCAILLARNRLCRQENFKLLLERQIFFIPCLILNLSIKYFLKISLNKIFQEALHNKILFGMFYVHTVTLLLDGCKKNNYPMM